MADLFERLYPTGQGESSIGVHYLRAALGDYATGNTTKAQIVSAFSLDSEAEADLTVLCNAIDSKAALGKAAFLLELHDVMMIAESGLKYATKAAFKTRMGL
jgi:hypothetical protein